MKNLVKAGLVVTTSMALMNCGDDKKDKESKNKKEKTAQVALHELDTKTFEIKDLASINFADSKLTLTNVVVDTKRKITTTTKLEAEYKLLEKKVTNLDGYTVLEVSPKNIEATTEDTDSEPTVTIAKDGKVVRDEVSVEDKTSVDGFMKALVTALDLGRAGLADPKTDLSLKNLFIAYKLEGEKLSLQMLTDFDVKAEENTFDAKAMGSVKVIKLNLKK